MNRALLTLLMVLAVRVPAAGAAEQAGPADLPDPLDPTTDFRESLYSFETDTVSASESLERVSGRFDRGYTTPEQTYRSENHGRTGPMGKLDKGES